MLTGIIKATRAHYAALQHKPSADRVALDYEVTGHTAGTVWVKIDPNNNGQRKREMTRLSNRLQSMFPEARDVHCAYRTYSGASRINQIWDAQQNEKV
jgi:hypothetical protein